MKQKFKLNVVQMLPIKWKFGIYGSPNIDDKYNSLYDTFTKIFEAIFPFKIQKKDKARREW